MALKGTSDIGEVVKKSVYKVRRKDSDVYDRVHFETSSEMVHDATSENTPNMVVKRDAEGKFKGVASMATQLEIAKNFSLSGDVVSKAVSFDGSSNVELVARLDDTILTGKVQEILVGEVENLGSNFFRKNIQNSDTNKFWLKNFRIEYNSTSSSIDFIIS